MIDRRTFLGALTAGSAFGLAGCLGANATCVSAAKDADYSAYASNEALFLETSGSVPTFVPGDTLALLKRAFGASQEFEALTIADNYNPDGYGPYSGFMIHEDTTADEAEDLFEQAGVDINSSWWDYQTPAPGSWKGVADRIETRYETAQEFTATQDGSISLPTVEIRETSTFEDGKQAAWAVTGADSDTHAQQAIQALNMPTGLAISPMHPRYTQHTILDPAAAITVIDVDTLSSGSSATYRVEASLNADSLESHLQNLPEGATSAQLYFCSTTLP